ncbi:MAG TPA: acyltransferase [Acidimicrobiales bacterium]|nr:acyltransferase [Acidimicrobiales bacterium]
MSVVEDATTTQTATDVGDVARAAADPPPDTPGGVDLEFRGDVEGLRAVAVLLVVLYHSGVSWLPGGFVGVDVFFVISGFLITGLLIREHEKRGRISLPGFYARRSRRILPAAMLVVIAVIVLGHLDQNFLSYGSGDSNTTTDAKFAALFAANIHFANVGTNYYDLGLPPSPLLHFWSLAVEEQFYVVWPSVVLFLGLLLRRWPLRYTVLAAALAATVGSYFWAVHAVDVNATSAFFSPFTRAWELGIGAVAAAVVAYAGRLNKWAGLALAWAGIIAIAVSANIYSDASNFPGPNALLPVLGTVAVIIGGASGIGAGHLLGFHPVRAVGRVSYGWYLLHYPPMILLAGSYWTGPLPVHERLLIALVTLAIAFVMYFLLEKPVRRSRYLAARPWMSIAMGASFVASAFVLAALWHKGL